MIAITMRSSISVKFQCRITSVMLCGFEAVFILFLPSLNLFKVSFQVHFLHLSLTFQMLCDGNFSSIACPPFTVVCFS